MQFQHLFTPIQIGPVLVKNRIVSLPHFTRFQFNRNNDPPDQYLEYQRSRAKGGSGLIILQPLRVHKATPGSGTSGPQSLEILKTKLTRMAQALHEHGAKVVTQLRHMGGEGDSAENAVVQAL